VGGRSFAHSTNGEEEFAWNSSNFRFSYGWTAQVFLDFFIASLSKSPSEAPHLVGLLWKSDRSVTQITHNTHMKEISMAPEGFKPATPLIE